jgi:hypothetical protein
VRRCAARARAAGAAYASDASLAGSPRLAAALVAAAVAKLYAGGAWAGRAGHVFHDPAERAAASQRRLHDAGAPLGAPRAVPPRVRAAPRVLGAPLHAAAPFRVSAAQAGYNSPARLRAATPLAAAAAGGGKHHP